MIRVDTLKYQASHGHTPRQPSGHGPGAWAFQIDQAPTPVAIRGTYREALTQAKQLAQSSITVLP